MGPGWRGIVMEALTKAGYAFEKTIEDSGLVGNDFSLTLTVVVKDHLINQKLEKITIENLL